MGTGKSKSNSQQQQQGKPLSDSKKKTRRASIDASASATAAVNQQSTIRHVGDGHDSPEQQFANWTVVGLVDTPMRRNSRRRDLWFVS